MLEQIESMMNAPRETDPRMKEWENALDEDLKTMRRIQEMDVHSYTLTGDQQTNAKVSRIIPHKKLSMKSKQSTQKLTSFKMLQPYTLTEENDQSKFEPPLEPMKIHD